MQRTWNPTKHYVRINRFRSKGYSEIPLNDEHEITRFVPAQGAVKTDIFHDDFMIEYNATTYEGPVYKESEVLGASKMMMHQGSLVEGSYVSPFWHPM